MKPPSTWTVIAVRSAPNQAWDALPGACVKPELVQAYATAGALVQRVRTAGNRATLEVRSC